MCFGWVADSADSEAKCRPLVDSSRQIECKLNEQMVECDKPMTQGTKAMVTCNTFYTTENEVADFETVCQTDGSWSRPVHRCVPRCGEAIFRDTRIPGYHHWWYLTDKTDRESSMYIPWHAGIYRKVDEGFLPICGGTIISERLIVTAAHCFWDPLSRNPRDKGQYKIAVGKIYNDWKKDEKNAQIPTIENIILHERFRGDSRNFDNDIALVILKDTLQMTQAVRPICLDYNKKYESLFVPGILGVVANRGGTGKDTYGETLRKLTLPYIGFEQCERGVPESFLPFLTNDKFCAGYLNGTSVCPGDAGGGYATQFSDGKWYLMGIVSVGLPSPDGSFCNLFAYTSYTKVFLSYDFIRSHWTDPF